MKAIYRAISVAAGAGILSAIFVSNAVGGCGDLASLQGPFTMAEPAVVAKALAPRVENGSPDQRGSEGSSASIVGMWKFQFLSKGNSTHNPSIPDGALLDFGFQHWHSDGTEFIESGGHSPATANFCLGVWGQTGFLTYEINHFPISYDATSGMIDNYINLKEKDTLSPSGDSYTGTLTLTVYDTKGNQVDQVTGMVVATRITVDTSVPDAIPDIR